MKTAKQIIKQLGKFISVHNFDNKPNQFILRFENGEILQSYKSIIVVILTPYISFDTPYYLGKDWDYSRTTGKYRNLFLGKTKKEIEQDITNKLAIVIKNL